MTEQLPAPDPSPLPHTEPLPDAGVSAGPGGRGPRGWVIPALAAGAVVAVVAAVAASGLGSGAGGLRPLALGGAATDGSALSASAELRAAASYELDAALPEGPSEEGVRRFTGVAAQPTPVARLAAALGIGAAPVRGSGQWEAAGPGGSLLVLDEPGQPWVYQRDGRLDRPGGCPDTPDNAVTSDPTVAPDAASTRCIGPPASAPPASGSGSATSGSATEGSAGAAEGTGSGEDSAPSPGAVATATPAPAPEPVPGTDPGWQPYPEPVPLPQLSPGPSADSARAIAAPVLAAVGLDATAARVEPGAPTTWVSLDPVVDGLPTTGWATSLTVDAGGTVYADGHLGTPERSDPYPLISAATAYEQLASQPMPAIGACPQPDPALGAPVDPAVTMPSCGAVRPLVITSVRLGLAPYPEGEDLVLAPTWLFGTADGWGPQVLAIAPEWVTEPSAPPVPEPAPAPAPAPAPTAPLPTEPVPGPGDPPAPEQPAIQVKPLGGDGRVVVAYYGGSGSCPPEVRVAEESADRVVLALVDSVPPDTACTADFRMYEREVTLSEPLGDRQVIDAATGLVAWPVD